MLRAIGFFLSPSLSVCRSSHISITYNTFIALRFRQIANRKSHISIVNNTLYASEQRALRLEKSGWKKGAKRAAVKAKKQKQ